jgi:hypothetical protein
MVLKGRTFDGITMIQVKSQFALAEFDIMKCHEMVQMVACKFQGDCFEGNYFI